MPFSYGFTGSTTLIQHSNLAPKKGAGKIERYPPLSDGKLMLLTTNGTVTRICDAFEGKPLFSLTGYQNNKVSPV
jgi:hypothetical protein